MLCSFAINKLWVVQYSAHCSYKLRHCARLYVPQFHIPRILYSAIISGARELAQAVAAPTTRPSTTGIELIFDSAEFRREEFIRADYRLSEKYCMLRFFKIKLYLFLSYLLTLFSRNFFEILIEIFCYTIQVVQ